MSVAEPLPRESYPLEPPAGFQDCCSRDGAIRLKARIEAYWRERGYVVNIRLDRKDFTSIMRTVRYDLRSDMVNALPRIRAVPSPEQDQ